LSRARLKPEGRFQEEVEWLGRSTVRSKNIVEVESDQEEPKGNLKELD
jgi:hypothetical protein